MDIWQNPELQIMGYLDIPIHLETKNDCKKCDNNCYGIAIVECFASSSK